MCSVTKMKSGRKSCHREIQTHQGSVANCSICLPRNLHVSEQPYSVVSQVFLHAYEPTHFNGSSNIVYLNVAEGGINYSSHWLLNQLIVHVQQHELQMYSREGLYSTFSYRWGHLLTSLSGTWQSFHQGGQPSSGFSGARACRYRCSQRKCSE